MHVPRIWIAGFIVVTATGLGRADTRRDFRELQGDWTLLRAQRGRTVVDESAEGSNLVVRGNSYAIGAAPAARNTWRTEAGQISVSSGRWPREIDLTITSGPNAGSVYRGIYEIVGDTQRVRFAQPGQSRPTSLDSAPSKSETAYTWRSGRPRIEGPVNPRGTTPQFNYSRYPQTPSGYYGGSPYAYPASPAGYYGGSPYAYPISLPTMLVEQR